MVFPDRSAAGRMLGAHLAQFANEKPLLVLALPRGGVPVAFEVAMALHAPLDVFLVRKLGFPGQEEFAIGAIASGGARLLNAAIIRSLHLPPEQVEEITERKQRNSSAANISIVEIVPPRTFDGHTVIIVDDGIATGSSMRRCSRGAAPEKSAQTDRGDSRGPFCHLQAIEARGRRGGLPLHSVRLLRRGRVVSRILPGQRRNRSRFAGPRPNLQSTDQSTLS